MINVYTLRKKLTDTLSNYQVIKARVHKRKKVIGIKFGVVEKL